MEHLPLNLHDYETAARGIVPAAVWDYVAGGSGDEVTLHANRSAFNRWRLLPRVLAGAHPVSTATAVLGQEIALPVLVAPSGRHRLCHDGGERSTARGAKAAGTIYIMSTAATFDIEEIAAEAGAWWFQLYVYRDREVTRDLVARAAAAGATALVVTVDVPMRGRREAEVRAELAFAREVNATFDPRFSWSDLDWLGSLTSMPIILKGVLHPADAARALDAGARAIVVSNHGGRQLDGAVAALDALPAVAAAVDGRAEVLVDGGVRRGTDVLKALALGAKAVLLGRPILWGLATAGEAGVCHILDLLRSELTTDLALCGRSSPREVDDTLIVPTGASLTRWEHA